MPNQNLAAPERPSLPWRGASALTMAATGGVARFFLFTGMCKYEFHGLESFTKLLDSRWDVEKRKKGLITGMAQTFS
jgi:hypothetical protein